MARWTRTLRSPLLLYCGALFGCGSAPTAEEEGRASSAEELGSGRASDPSEADRGPSEADREGTPSERLASDCRGDGDGKTTLVFTNHCQETIEIRGTDIDGVAVSPAESSCVDVGSDSEVLQSKRYWGYVGEDPGMGHHTLAEFTFNTDFHDFDWYNISHVDAHNLPMQIAALDRAECEPVTCSDTWLESCPEVGKLRNDDGEVISCVSQNRDDPQSEVALFFETCDEGYAWSADDQEGADPSPMFACAGEDWNIVFCPEAE